MSLWKARLHAHRQGRRGRCCLLRIIVVIEQRVDGFPRHITDFLAGHAAFERVRLTPVVRQLPAQRVPDAFAP